MPAKGWIEVSDLYCKGCELCISACPQEVISLDMDRLTPKG
ncbi:MAG TPA: 4Fe-4S ferredoxin, partial [Anaerolineae bacterium]|nr:4Fe-4S ferredoxin [Anaerolineae bacterium]